MALSAKMKEQAVRSNAKIELLLVNCIRPKTVLIIGKRLVILYSKLFSIAMLPSSNIPLIKNTDTAGTGFVIVDFNNNEISKNPALYKWITDNAYKYGFVHENGGFQYVGVGVAAYAKTGNAYKTFVSNVKAKTAGAEMGIGNGYKAYYVAADATEIKVPSNLSYEVFADGASGYIVVVKTSK